MDARAKRYYAGALAGDAAAQNELGVDYKEGRGGVPKDGSSATYWFYKAAAQGHVLAISNVGLQYFHGDGVSHDYKEATHWFERAAEMGNAEAMAYLGRIYWAGLSGEADIEQAAYWYRRAMNMGDPEAINNSAWFFATVDDERYLDPGRAVEAMEILILFRPKAIHYDTLAAAYAANSEFLKAIAAVVIAIDMATEIGEMRNLEGFLKRRELYLNRKRFTVIH